MDSLSTFYPEKKDQDYQEYRSSIPTQMTPKDPPIPMLFRINPLKPNFDESPCLSLPIGVVSIKLLKMRIIDSGDIVKLSEKRMKSIIDIWKKDKKEFLPDEFDELLAEVSITNEF